MLQPKTLGCPLLFFFSSIPYLICQKSYRLYCQNIHIIQPVLTASTATTWLKSPQLLPGLSFQLLISNLAASLCPGRLFSIEKQKGSFKCSHLSSPSFPISLSIKAIILTTFRALNQYHCITRLQGSISHTEFKVNNLLELYNCPTLSGPHHLSDLSLITCLLALKAPATLPALLFPGRYPLSSLKHLSVGLQHRAC